MTTKSPKKAVLQRLQSIFTGIIAAVMVMCLSPATQAADKVRVYIGTQQRPDVMKILFEEYMATHPGTNVELEAGPSSSDLQQKYLSTILSAKDSSLDVFLVDIIRPAEYEASGWAEPLDKYLGTASASYLDKYCIYLVILIETAEIQIM